MILSSIKLTNYRNHASGQWQLHEKWNCITGLNGTGKSNLLDAMNVLSMLRSFNSKSDESNVRHESDFFRIDGQYQKDGKGYQVVVKYQKGKRKVIEVNGKKTEKMADHIGLFPSLLIQPIDDYKLMLDSSQRRKLLDQAISQISKSYLKALMSYNRLLKQRNALLKSCQKGFGNRDQIFMYDDQMAELVKLIYKSRTSFIQNISKPMSSFYDCISGDKEQCFIEFEPSVSADEYLTTLRSTIHEQVVSGRTPIGPHRDDIGLYLNGKKLSKVGSQGQRKSFLTALKVAIYSLLFQELGEQPLLFLDDLFDKLDNERVKNLLTLLSSDEFGQVFITDKDEKHLTAIMSDLNLEHEHIYLQHEPV